MDGAAAHHSLSSTAAERLDGRPLLFGSSIDVTAPQGDARDLQNPSSGA